MTDSSPPEPPTRDVGDPLDPQLERSLAVRLFNRCWELIEKPGRTPQEDEELVDAAHASRYHWSQVGDTAHRARGDWMIARAYSEVGQADAALHHAERCLATVAHPATAGAFEDWDLPAAHEGVARAHLVAGHEDKAREHAARARSTLDRVADPEDAAVVYEALAHMGI